MTAGVGGGRWRLVKEGGSGWWRRFLYLDLQHLMIFVRLLHVTEVRYASVRSDGGVFAPVLCVCIDREVLPWRHLVRGCVGESPRCSLLP